MRRADSEHRLGLGLGRLGGACTGYMRIRGRTRRLECHFLARVDLPRSAIHLRGAINLAEVERSNSRASERHLRSLVIVFALGETFLLHNFLRHHRRPAIAEQIVASFDTGRLHAAVCAQPAVPAAQCRANRRRAN